MLIELKKKLKSRRNFLRSRGPCRPMDPGRFAKPSLQMKQRQLKLAPVTMTEAEFCKRPKNPQKSKWFQSFKNYDPNCLSRIPDPDADFLPSRIQDPGVKKAPNPGSATLVSNSTLPRCSINILV
jgi:hypothetical protein